LAKICPEPIPPRNYCPFKAAAVIGFGRRTEDYQRIVVSSPKAGSMGVIREDREVAENADISDNVRGTALAKEFPLREDYAAKSKAECGTVVQSK
jgi:hypothetical protein